MVHLRFRVVGEGFAWPSVADDENGKSGKIRWTLIEIRDDNKKSDIDRDIFICRKRKRKLYRTVIQYRRKKERHKGEKPTRRMLRFDFILLLVCGDRKKSKKVRDVFLN